MVFHVIFLLPPKGAQGFEIDINLESKAFSNWDPFVATHGFKPLRRTDFIMGSHTVP